MGLRWKRQSLPIMHAIKIIDSLTIINKIRIRVTKSETLKYYERQQSIAEKITIITIIILIVISIWVNNKLIIRLIKEHHQSKYE